MNAKGDLKQRFVFIGFTADGGANKAKAKENIQLRSFEKNGTNFFGESLRPSLSAPQRETLFD